VGQIQKIRIERRPQQAIGDEQRPACQGVPGIDGVTWYAYQEENLEEKLKDLHGRIHRGQLTRPRMRVVKPPC
jgi:hypothetical protein